MMEIPTSLSEVLQEDDSLNGAVHTVLALIRPWFEDNKLVFFPEYTDHGPKHIQDVFNTTESLISADAWNILRPADIATLIIGILLHDCAMHLSEEGFITLITQKRDVNEGFRDKSWQELWYDFIAEAKRFDERKLLSLFGDTEPVQPPPLDALEMTKRNRLLIGEFLRRHHPRLAHEIALIGIPGTQGDSLSIGNIPDDIKELAGVVARSHGMDLRKSIDYLNAKGRLRARRTAGVHVTYLMTLVRIADYIQIQSERAPQVILKIRSLKSPVSRGEWNAHAAITDIHQEIDDPEAIWVEAAPQDVKTYLKIKDLLLDIQRELDDSWAVLGEIYGPKPELGGLGLVLRRIKSNLDDTETFAKTVKYIPCRVSLETAGTDLLKLLIKPLYGDSPEIGIRELLQNAVDACRELNDYLEQHPSLPNFELQQQCGDVIIALEAASDGSKWVVVSDKGIGMTPEIILNYFLKAGASFRNSDAWRKQHEDEQGQVRVLRSGRFGIGVLAGFLLGEVIEVTTRHITAHPNEGIAFTCRLVDETIQLNRVSRPVGTTIRIQISDDIFARLNVDRLLEGGSKGWDWYCLEYPIVHRLLLPKDLRLKQRYVVPNEYSVLSSIWRRIKHPEFSDIQWSYLAYAPHLVCNGIIIKEEPQGDTSYTSTLFSPWGTFHKPKISVYDPSGKLPLTLQRTGLTTSRHPFEEELIADIHKDFLAYLLLFAPSVGPLHNGTGNFAKSFSYPGLQVYPWCLCAPEGISLLTPWHLEQLEISSLLISSSGDLPYLKLITEGEKDQALVLAQMDEISITSKDRKPRALLSARNCKWWIDRVGKNFVELKGTRIIGRASQLKRLRDKPTRSIGNFKEEWTDGNLIILKEGNCPSLEININNLSLIPKQYGFNLVLAYIKTNSSSPFVYDKSPLVHAWREIIQSPYIPYNLEERQKHLADAFTKLSPYIQAWKSINNNADSEVS